jgi:hypothetical protein
MAFALSAVGTAQRLLFDTRYSDILRVGFGGDISNITQVFALVQVCLEKMPNTKEQNHKRRVEQSRFLSRINNSSTQQHTRTHVNHYDQI